MRYSPDIALTDKHFFNLEISKRRRIKVNLFSRFNFKF